MACTYTHMYITTCILTYMHSQHVHSYICTESHNAHSHTCIYSHMYRTTHIHIVTHAQNTFHIYAQNHTNEYTS